MTDQVVSLCLNYIFNKIAITIANGNSNMKKLILRLEIV